MLLFFIVFIAPLNALKEMFLIKNDKIFIIISGIIFGLAHVIGSSSIIQYIYIFDYGFCGAYLAYLYTRYNNIYLNMSAHFIMNFIATLSMLIRLIKKRKNNL